MNHRYQYTYLEKQTHSRMEGKQLKATTSNDIKTSPRPASTRLDTPHPVRIPKALTPV